MRLTRLILAAVVASAVALAPVVSALAAAPGNLETHKIEAQAHAKVAMKAKVATKDCHQSAPQPAHKTGPKTGHCPDCGSNGTCGAACLLKCSQLAATLEPATVMLGSPIPHAPVMVAAAPPGWSAKPPAPPPRA